jgi:hypothetical protein
MRFSSASTVCAGLRQIARRIGNRAPALSIWPHENRSHSHRNPLPRNPKRHHTRPRVNPNLRIFRHESTDQGLKLAEDGKDETVAYVDRRERMPEIVDPNAFEHGATLTPPPRPDQEQKPVK